MPTQEELEVFDAENRINDVLRTQADLLTAIASIPRDDPEQAALQAKRTEIRLKVAMLWTEEDAIKAHKGRLTRPSDGDVDEIATLEAEVDQAIKKAKTAGALIRVAGDAANLANKVASVSKTQRGVV